MPVALTQEQIRVHDASMDYVGKTSLSASKAIAWQRCSKGSSRVQDICSGFMKVVGSDDSVILCGMNKTRVAYNTKVRLIQ